MAEAVPSAKLVYLPGGALATADDATLARAMIGGDAQAPRVAWSRFAPMVHRMFTRTFGPGQDVDDMVQDVFVCLFRKVGGLREPKALKAFVVSITAMTIKYELRQRRVRRWIHISGDISDRDAPRIEQPDASARQAVMSFYAILNKLNARDRTAFVLRFFEGLDLTETAAALGISVSTTKRNLTRIWQRVALQVQRTPELEAYLPKLPNVQQSQQLPELPKLPNLNQAAAPPPAQTQPFSVLGADTDRSHTDRSNKAPFGEARNLGQGKDRRGT